MELWVLFIFYVFCLPEIFFWSWTSTVFFYNKTKSVIFYIKNNILSLHLKFSHCRNTVTLGDTPCPLPPLKVFCLALEPQGLADVHTFLPRIFYNVWLFYTEHELLLQWEKNNIAVFICRGQGQQREEKDSWECYVSWQGLRITFPSLLQTLSGDREGHKPLHSYMLLGAGTDSQLGAC